MNTRLLAIAATLALCAGVAADAQTQTQPQRSPTGAPIPGAAPTTTTPATRVPSTRVPGAQVPTTRIPGATTGLARPPFTRPPTRGGVDWAGAIGGLRQSGGAEQKVAPRLDPAAIDRTQVPVLLLNDAALMGTARIYSFGDYYTITGNIPGGGISLSGTTTTIPIPPTTRLNMPNVGPEQLTIQRTVDGQLASFVRYGVLYTVEVTCDAPTDPRCRNEAYVRDLVAKSTLVVMGQAARQAAGLGG